MRREFLNGVRESQLQPIPMMMSQQEVTHTHTHTHTYTYTHTHTSQLLVILPRAHFASFTLVLNLLLMEDHLEASQNKTEFTGFHVE